MPFRLRKDTRKWFKNISFDIDFDMYYFCLIAGFAMRRKADIPQAETTDLVDDFPGSYRPKGRLITALFLSREIKELSIRLSERTTLHAAIQRLVSPLSASHLSDVGMKEMNRYSFGGFEVLTEWFPEPPQTIETFLPLYKRHIDNAISSSKET